jgi:hypothetical protein
MSVIENFLRVINKRGVLSIKIADYKFLWVINKCELAKIIAGYKQVRVIVKQGFYSAPLPPSLSQRNF